MLINHYTNSYEYAFHIPSGCGRKDTCMHPCMHIDIHTKRQSVQIAIIKIP